MPTHDSILTSPQRTDAPSTNGDVRVLVSAASKHGATAEIAQRIGATLTDRGFDVTVNPPEAASFVEDFHAVVLGSAVYAGHWQQTAEDLAARVAATEPAPLVWLFSSGPLGDPPKPEEDPVDVADILSSTSAQDHRVFSGKIDKSKLSFGERAIMVAVRAPEGDFRNWEEIAGWAGEIGDELDALVESSA